MTTEDEHYYVEGSSVEDDPYCQANGVLVNLLGITETAALNEIEVDLALLGAREILNSPAPSAFSSAHLQSLHRTLFDGVYPWAGLFRRVDIAKGDTVFESHAKIEQKLTELFATLESQKFLMGTTVDEFASAAASFLLELNRIHPFREGNGRSQRILLTQIALNAGFDLSWDGVGPAAMRESCLAGLKGDIAPMRKLLKLNISAASSVGKTAKPKAP